MTTRQRLIFSAISAIFLVWGLLAIATGSQTSSSKLGGIVTLTGADATWSGATGILIGLLPLAVWLPKRCVGWYVALSWLGLMSWLYLTIFAR